MTCFSAQMTRTEFYDLYIIVKEYLWALKLKTFSKFILSTPQKNIFWNAGRTLIAINWSVTTNSSGWSFYYIFVFLKGDWLVYIKSTPISTRSRISNLRMIYIIHRTWLMILGFLSTLCWGFLVLLLFDFWLNTNYLPKTKKWSIQNLYCVFWLIGGPSHHKIEINTDPVISKMLSLKQC